MTDLDEVCTVGALLPPTSMLRLVLLGLILFATACDSTEPELPTLGQFEASITGDLDRALEGDATFSTFAGFEGSESTRVLTLTLAARTTGTRLGRFVTLTDYEGRISGPGVYDLSDNRLESLPLMYFDERANVEAVWIATEGTLRVTRFDDDRIEGEITADLKVADFGVGSPSRTATLQGSFEAVSLPEIQER